MPSYLTEYTNIDKDNYMGAYVPGLGMRAGPRIEARTWQEAERKLDVLKELGMVHPEIKIVGSLEEEYDA